MTTLTIDQLRYAGFWPRLGALLLDMLVLLPLGALEMWGSARYRLFELYYFIPHILFYLFYNVYLVQRFGGTPGKLIVGVRILKVSGEPVGWRESFLRYVVEFVFVLLFITALVMSLLQMSDTEYRMLSFIERSKRIHELYPSWYKPLQIVAQVWFWGELIVLLTNRRRRALHDFIAGTVVVRTSPEKTQQSIPGDWRGKKKSQVVLLFFLIGCLVLGSMLVPYCGGEDDLCDAARKGNLARVKALIAAKENVNAKYIFGRTALMYASNKGHVEVIRTLLAAKADVNAKDKGGRTALMDASYEGHIEVVQALLAAKADVNARDKEGSSALQWASVGGNVEVVRALLAAKANVNAKNNNGITALMNASFKSNDEVVRELLAAKAEVNAKDKDGDTALMWAKKNNGIMALIWGRQGSQSEVVKLLKQAGTTE